MADVDLELQIAEYQRKLMQPGLFGPEADALNAKVQELIGKKVAAEVAADAAANPPPADPLEGLTGAARESKRQAAAAKLEELRRDPLYYANPADAEQRVRYGRLHSEALELAAIAYAPEGEG